MSEEKKVVLVTGASSGIGNSCATYLAKRGCIVYGTCRNPEQAQKKADEFFHMLPMDITNELSVKTVIDSIYAQNGAIDMLVCNAGMGIAGPVEFTSTASAELQMQTNFMGTFRVIRDVLPGMRMHGGKIIVMSSLAGLTGIPFQAFYSASKFALEGFVESLRMELKPYPVQICLLEPGDFRTGFTAARQRNLIAQENPYYKAYTNSVKVMELDEQNGADPILISRLIYKLFLSKSRFKIRYSVGMIFQRLAMALKKVMHAQLFEAFFCKYYKVDGK